MRNAKVVPHYIPELDFCYSPYSVVMLLKPGSHMSPMIGESLSVTIQEENSQRILLMSSHKQWSSPMSATYENQALGAVHAGDLYRSEIDSEPFRDKCDSQNGAKIDLD